MWLPRILDSDSEGGADWIGANTTDSLHSLWKIRNRNALNWLDFERFCSLSERTKNAPHVLWDSEKYFCRDQVEGDWRSIALGR